MTTLPHKLSSGQYQPMDFDGEERYACAAIFTLALHLCQVRSQTTGIHTELSSISNSQHTHPSYFSTSARLKTLHFLRDTILASVMQCLFRLIMELRTKMQTQLGGKLLPSNKIASCRVACLIKLLALALLYRVLLSGKAPPG